jgi:hypothetical protein
VYVPVGKPLIVIQIQVGWLDDQPIWIDCGVGDVGDVGVGVVGVGVVGVGVVGVGVVGVGVVGVGVVGVGVVGDGVGALVWIALRAIVRCDPKSAVSWTVCSFTHFVNVARLSSAAAGALRTAAPAMPIARSTVTSPDSFALQTARPIVFLPTRQSLYDAKSLFTAPIIFVNGSIGPEKNWASVSAIT